MNPLVKRSLVVSVFFLMVGLVPRPAFADDWVVRRNNGNMNCYVQRATGLASPAPSVLSRHSSQSTACSGARDLFSDEGDAQKCQAYTPNTRRECAALGVSLP